MYLAEKFAADADALRGPLRGALRYAQSLLLVRFCQNQWFYG